MAMVDLRHLHTVKARGKVYRYAWRGGPRLREAFGTPDFVKEYAEAHAARIGGDKSKLVGLIVSYRASDEWTGLAPKTRINWAPWLDRIQKDCGDMSIASFDRPIARRMIKLWRDRYKKHPRSADMGLQTFSRLLSFGVAEGRLVANMATGIPHIYRNDRSELVWTAAELAALEKVASPEIMQAARLAALTGLRQADLLKLSWSHVKPNSIEIKTGKSNQRKTTLIPIYSELRAHLEAIPKRSTRVLTNTEGRPWSTGFGSSWGKACARAGIEELHFHDLRGTAATRFYLAGLEIREIAEIMTWSEERIESLINRYVKRDEILLRRIAKLDEAGTGTQAVKLAVKPPTSE